MAPGEKSYIDLNAYVSTENFPKIQILGIAYKFKKGSTVGMPVYIYS